MACKLTSSKLQIASSILLLFDNVSLDLELAWFSSKDFGALSISLLNTWKMREIRKLETIQMEV